jgi:hypothetical protein
MPRYLMDLCFIYQEGDCPIDDIKNARRVGKIEEDKMKLFPSGEDQECLTSAKFGQGLISPKLCQPPVNALMAER